MIALSPAISLNPAIMLNPGCSWLVLWLWLGLPLPLPLLLLLPPIMCYARCNSFKTLAVAAAVAMAGWATRTGQVCGGGCLTILNDSLTVFSTWRSCCFHDGMSGGTACLSDHQILKRKQKSDRRAVVPGAARRKQHDRQVLKTVRQSLGIEGATPARPGLPNARSGWLAGCVPG